MPDPTPKPVAFTGISLPPPIDWAAKQAQARESNADIQKKLAMPIPEAVAPAPKKLEGFGDLGSHRSTAQPGKVVPVSLGQDHKHTLGG